MNETITNWGNTNPKNKKDKEPRPNLVAQMAADIDTEREQSQRDEAAATDNKAARVGEEQQQSATAPEAPAPAPKPSKSKRTKLTDQGVTQLVINSSYKKHTMTVYDPLYQLVTAMALSWHVHIQDAIAIIMMEGVRNLKVKNRKQIDNLIRNFAHYEDTDAEIAETLDEMSETLKGAFKGALFAQAGHTPADLK